jgi:hypothetical protein
MDAHVIQRALTGAALVALVGSLLAGCGAGAPAAATPGQASASSAATAPAATAPAAITAVSTASPAASVDEDLMAKLNAIWGGTADAAAVAALYAPDATFHDTIDGRTYSGLEAIQAKVAANASAGFTCEQGSTPIRQGNVVAVFHRFHAGGAEFPVLAVFELKDGKVISQWAYPAP